MSAARRSFRYDAAVLLAVDDATAIDNLFEVVGVAFDVAGVGAIVIGAAIATFRYLRSWLSKDTGNRAYTRYRQDLGRSLLLGLEILVAADIIKTVAVEPTLESLGVLGLLVLIRTFLNWALVLEIEGRWPWSRPSAPES